MLKHKGSWVGPVVQCGYVFAVFFLFFSSVQAQSVIISDTQVTTQNLILSPPATEKTAAVTSTGQVDVAGFNGIYALDSGWSLTNDGIVRGSSGVYMNVGGSVTNRGEITGRSAYGLFFGGSSVLTNETTGVITGGTSSAAGTGVYLFGGDTAIAIDNSGRIQAYGNGATAGNAISILNNGVLGLGSGSVINRAGGWITGGFGSTSGVGISMTTNTASVDNAGTITGNGSAGHGIYLNTSATALSSATVQNRVGGVITGGGNNGTGVGVYIIGTGNVDNSGTITGNGAQQGVYIQGKGTVTNRSGGAITGIGATIGVNITGIPAGGEGKVTNEAGATITGGNNGVVISGSGTVVNEGEILGNNPGFYGLRFSNSAAGTYTTDVTNKGNIFGGGVGLSINFSNAGAKATNKINNTGTIKGTGAGNSGITIQGTGVFTNTITNSGTIAGSAYGAQLNSGSMTNSGAITGSTGVQFTGGGDDALTNMGAISGSGGTAVDMGGGNDKVTLGTGSLITGTIDGGSGTDSLALTGNGTIGVGQFTNFETLIKDGTGTWTLTGTGSIGGGIAINQGTLITSGNITLNAGGTLNNVSTLSNAGTLINNGTITGTGGYIQTTGQTINNGSMTQSSILIDGGILSGTGTITGDVTIGSGAILSPGSSPGTLTMTGNFSSNGILDFELGGLGAGQYDVLDIFGNATFTGGNIHFHFVNDFQASENNYWDFLFANSIEGWNRLTFNFDDLDPGLGWKFEQITIANGERVGERLLITQNGGTSVPEPATLLLLGFGLIGLAGIKRKFTK
jgi:hypothetical protein